jgi:hypothetical protein
MAYMKLEELNKSQIILLTLLTSFVTSIATGIVTVALIEEAPADVTRVVQRVVEHTVETVTPGEQQATVITTEKTVIVKESDLIAESVKKTQSRVLSIVDDAGAFVTLGTLVSTNGLIVADVSTLADGKTYSIQVGDTAMPLKVLGADGGVALLQFTGDAVKTDKVVLADASPSLGQTVFTFVGEKAGGIAQGIVARVTDTAITTDISAGSVTAGAPIFTVDGQLAGISAQTSRDVNASAYVPVSVIKALIQKATAPPEPAS